jgi:hypothetical protein
MATGSYEGSLSMEGASDHLQLSIFTGRWQGWSWRALHSSDPSASSETNKGTQVDSRPRTKVT